jgi:hypothetical protein
LWIWYNTKIISDIREEPSKSDESGKFQIRNFGFNFNAPSFREFGNVYNDKCMDFYEHIEYVDGKPQIKNAVDFNHKYRPNRKMTASEIEIMMNDDQKNEYHMKEREFLQWVPSRDWSRLFMLS